MLPARKSLQIYNKIFQKNTKLNTKNPIIR